MINPELFVPLNTQPFVSGDRTIPPFIWSLRALPEPTNPIDLNVPIGMNDDKVHVSADLHQYPHMLIGGTSGAGKSVFSHCVLGALLLRNKPTNLKLASITPRGSAEFRSYAGLPNLLFPPTSTKESAIQALKHLTLHINGRGFEKAHNDAIVVVIDDYRSFEGSYETVQPLLKDLLERGPNVGIHVILCTQKSSDAYLPKALRELFPLRIALTTFTKKESRALVGALGAEMLRGYGDLLFLRGPQKKATHLQGYALSLKETGFICDYVRNNWPNKHIQWR